MDWTPVARRFGRPPTRGNPVQRHEYQVYEIAGTDPPVVFAAGEFSFAPA